MPTTNYPNGQSLVSSALSVAQMQLIWQTITLQMLGIPAFFDTATVAANNNLVTVTNAGAYSVGQEIAIPGVLPAVPATTIQSINGQVLTVSANATAPASAVQCSVCAAGAGGTVRIEWPTNGQPDWATTQDVAFVGCTLAPGDYTKIRDKFPTSASGSTVSQQWNYTRIWRVGWTLYGPNSLTNAAFLASGLFQDFVAQFLTQFNLYPILNFDEPRRAPEEWQSQWYERVDFDVLLNEAVVDIVQEQTGISVQVQISDSKGIVATDTITES